MHSKTVLVIEDDPLLRMDAVLLLREAGLNVVEMDNADDALAYMLERSAAIAAIFSDIQMPGHSDGLYLAELVSRHWPHILVLLSSGRRHPERPLPSNVRFLPKPWRPLDVLTTMQNAAAA